MCCDWNEFNLKGYAIINWRASLVPAAAVIPAPIAYIKVVAVKKLVVGLVRRFVGPPFGCVLYGVRRLSGERCHVNSWCGIRSIYFEEIRVFSAGICLEYVSME